MVSKVFKILSKDTVKHVTTLDIQKSDAIILNESCSFLGKFYHFETNFSERYIFNKILSDVDSCHLNSFSSSLPFRNKHKYKKSNIENKMFFAIKIKTHFILRSKPMSNLIC